MKGFIKLHRRILDWEWYKDSNTKNIFIHILLNACYDNCRFMGQTVNRGEYITSLSRLSSDLKIPIRQVRTSLKRLKKTGEIDMQTTNKYSKIIVCEYESYQLQPSNIKTKTTSNRQATDKQPTDINKKERKKESKNNIFHKECLSSTLWIEVVCMQYFFSKDDLVTCLNAFMLHLRSTDDNKITIKDYKSHFVNWLKYNKQNFITNKTGQYEWMWNGQNKKTGTLQELNRDKSLFDKEGFGFTIIKNG